MKAALLAGVLSGVVALAASAQTTRNANHDITRLYAAGDWTVNFIEYTNGPGKGRSACNMMWESTNRVISVFTFNNGATSFSFTDTAWDIPEPYVDIRVALDREWRFTAKAEVQQNRSLHVKDLTPEFVGAMMLSSELAIGNMNMDTLMAVRLDGVREAMLELAKCETVIQEGSAGNPFTKAKNPF